MTEPFSTAVVDAELNWGNLDTALEEKVRRAARKASQVAQREFDRGRLTAEVKIEPILGSSFEERVRAMANSRITRGISVEIDPEFGSDFQARLRAIAIARNFRIPVELEIENLSEVTAQLEAITRDRTQRIRIETTGGGNGGAGAGGGGAGGGSGGGRSTIDSLTAATERLTRAQMAQETAAGRVRVEEARLNELRNQSNVSASRLIAAEESVARARRANEDSLRSVQRAQQNVRETRDRTNGDDDTTSRISRLLSRFAQNGAVSISAIASAARLATVPLLAMGAITFVPLIASATQALGVIALLPGAAAVAGAGLASLVIGFNGIGSAFSALSDDTASAASNGASQARAVESALRQVEDAEKGVIKAKKDARDAEKDVTRARKDAQEQLEDLNLALRGASLSEKDAVLSLKEARRDLLELGKDGPVDPLDRERAQLRVADAEQRLLEVQEKNKDLAEETRDANIKGVEGSDQVTEAKERLAEANDRVRESEQRVIDAQRAVSDAQSQTAGGVDKVAAALAKLSPNAKEFVLAMQALGPSWTDLRKTVQDRLFENLGTSVTALANAQLPGLKVGLSGIADVINKNLIGALAFLSTESAKSDFSRIFENARVAIDNLLGAFGNLGGAFLDIAAVGSDFLPGLTGPDGFLGWTQRFADKIKEMRENGDLQKFIQGAIDKFGELWTIGGQIIELIRNIFGGSKETGDSMLVSISDTLTKWNEFLGSEEGQQKMKDFFEDVRQTCSEIAGIIGGIVSGISEISKINDTLGLGQGGNSNSLPDNIGSNGQEVVGKNSFFPGFEKGGVGDKIGQFGGDVADFFSGDAWSFLNARDGESPFQASMRLAGDSFSEFGTKISDVVTAAPALFGLLKDQLTGLANNAYDNVTTRVGSVFDGMGTKITDTVNSITGTAIPALQVGVTAVGDFFGGLGTRVASVWDAIVATIKSAVGRIGRFLVSLPSVKIPDIPGVPGRGTSIGFQDIGQSMVNFAAMRSGGLARGPGGPTDDLIPTMLSNGEYVNRASSVTPKTLPLLEAINGGWVPSADFLQAMVYGNVLRRAGGGLVSAQQVNDFPRSGGLEGAPYVWGGVNWGDCSGAVSGVVNYAVGDDPFGSRGATGNFDTWLAKKGLLPGLGPAGSLNVGWFNGGPYGGHTAATLPDGTNIEMGGGRGDGQVGGGAAGADDSQFTDHAHLPPEFFAGGDRLPGEGDPSFGSGGGTYSGGGGYVGGGGTSAAYDPAAVRIGTSGYSLPDTGPSISGAGGAMADPYSIGTGSWAERIDAGNRWAADQNFGTQAEKWGYDALGSIASDFLDPIGLGGLAKDQIGTAYEAMMAARSAANSQGTGDGKLADTIIFEGMDPQKTAQENERMMRSRTTPATVTTRNGG
ncbi:hypothetical protein [Rhodococcoides trifolii]|uniref:hypothetical protein n=1 Tax=Rhodococcoides trifolii TaxID=908250 RepID=UPI0016692089|nr:hypothetical protein [Rhodococcus trifolii]